VLNDRKNVVFISLGKAEKDLEEWLSHMALGRKRIYAVQDLSELQKELQRLVDEETLDTGVFIMTEEVGNRSFRKCGLKVRFPPGAAVLFTAHNDRYLFYPKEKNATIEDLLLAAK
jgi:hypothetical protein